MTTETWLIIDGGYLGHRAFFALKDLAFEGLGTAIPYGFFRDILKLQEKFQTRNFAFCFDQKPYKRRNLLSTYKAGKEIYNTEFRNTKQEVNIQLDRLRDDLLPSVGYRNVFSQRGYEADDLIARLCQDQKPNQEFILISADRDLYQLLNDKLVLIYDLKKDRMVTEESFVKEWGITPDDWPLVKCLGGRKNNVRGISGIGEKFAAAWIRGDLNPKCQAYQKIDQGNIDAVNRNMPLVKLPFPGTERMKLQRDKTSPDAWFEMMDKLGIRTFNRQIRRYYHGKA